MAKKNVQKAPSSASNRKASFDVAVEETIEAGLILDASEVKAARAGRVQLTGSYIKFLGQPARPVLVGAHFATAAEPERSRPLLLSKKQLLELHEELQIQGQTAVALKLYFSRGWAKLLIGMGKGRKGKDKRELLKKRDVERELQRSQL